MNISDIDELDILGQHLLRAKHTQTSGLPFSFPVSPDDFISYQEYLVGKPLSLLEQRAIAIWVPIFNDSFHDGQMHNIIELNTYLSRIDQLTKDASPILKRFLLSARAWIIFAWKQGAAKQAE